MLKLIGTTLLSALLFIACKDDDPKPDGKKPAPAVSAVSAGSTLKDVPIDITVKFSVHNGCGQFHAFQPSGSGTKTDVKIIADYGTDRICTQAIEIRETTYTFRTSVAGTHYVRFWTGGEPVVDTIEVK